MTNDLDELITEVQLRAAGFKWEQLDRQPSKHWLLWLAPACIDHFETNRRMFSGTEDLGIEIAFDTPDNPFWYCWIRADYAGRYSRFLHVRHLKYWSEVVQLIEALTGRQWQQEDVFYGAFRSPEDAERYRKESERLDQRLARDWGPRYCRDKKITDDPSQIGILGRDL